MQREIYNDFYKKHGVGIHADPVRFSETAKLCRGRTLDIACGTGDLADYYKGEYVGVDISDVAVKLAKESRRKDAEFLVADWTKPITEGGDQYDTIVMAEFLEHLENDDILFQNILKFAKANARIIISVPNGDRIPDENHFREFTIPSMRARFSKLGKVSFYNWLGVEGRILMTIDLGKENKNDLTLSMIVRNEGKGLEKAILSTIEIVDKIVVSVDSKSDDKTLEIARRYADIVKIHEWKDNFAEARNFVDEGIDSKWILSLDGHEFIEQAPNLADKLKQDVDGLIITMRMEGGDTFIVPRIYRQGLPWEHAIHNAIPVKTSDKYTDFIIVHDRAGGQAIESTRKRMEQVKVMMKKELEKELKIPGYETRALFYLARYYRQFREWNKALKYYKKYLRKSTFIGEKWLCAYEAGIIANAMNKPLKALKFFNLANEASPDRWEISKHIGLTYMAFDQYEKGVKYLVDSLKQNEGDFSFKPEERNDGDIWDKIGFCLFMLGKYTEAKTAWERSIEIGKDPIQKMLNKKRIELLEKEHGI